MFALVAACGLRTPTTVHGEPTPADSTLDVHIVGATDAGDKWMRVVVRELIPSSTRRHHSIGQLLWVARVKSKGGRARTSLPHSAVREFLAVSASTSQSCEYWNAAGPLQVDKPNVVRIPVELTLARTATGKVRHSNECRCEKSVVWFRRAKAPWAPRGSAASAMRLFPLDLGGEPKAVVSRLWVSRSVQVQPSGRYVLRGIEAGADYDLDVVSSTCGESQTVTWKAEDGERAPELVVQEPGDLVVRIDWRVEQSKSRYSLDLGPAPFRRRRFSATVSPTR